MMATLYCLENNDKKKYMFSADGIFFLKYIQSF
jgi:hypothetical protein